MFKIRRILICTICILFFILNIIYVQAGGEDVFCSINDFEDFHYYLFCQTCIGTHAPDVNPIISTFTGSDAETSEAGVRLYQRYMEPFWANDHGENMELEYISPDCKMAVTSEAVEGDTSGTRWRLFDGEKEKQQQVIDIRDSAPFRIIKSGEDYAVIDWRMLYEKISRTFDKSGHPYCWRHNEQGDLAVGEKCRYNKLNNTYIWEMAICDLESEAVLWTFHGKGFPILVQLQGNRESGKVVFQLGDRSFYELTYSSGDIKYLGEDMYCLSFSPDRKYVAYSSPCCEDFYDLEEKEAEEVGRILPGIYILEVETGKTAYIEQDIDDIVWAQMLDGRNFQWVEKDCFEKVLEERK